MQGLNLTEINQKYIDEVFQKMIQVYQSENAIFCNFGKIMNWGEDVLKLCISDETFSIPFNNFNFQDPTLVKKTIGVVLVRLALFCLNMASLDDYDIFASYALRLSLFGKQDLPLYLPQIINASRGLIDNKTAALNSTKFLKSCPKRSKLSIAEQTLFDKTIQRFNETLETNLAKNAFRTFLGSNPIYKNLNENDLIRFLKSMKVEWVENAEYWGMVFLDKELLENYNENKCIARIIGLCYHEGMHAVMIEFFENFCWLTPRIVKNTDSFSFTDLEGGLMMEELIFGDFNIEYWEEADRVLDMNNWNSNKSIFGKHEKINKRGIKNPHNSSLCEHNRKREI